MNMDESIIGSAIIDKLPPSWKDYKRNLKHKKEDITMEELAQNLRIEEEYRIILLMSKSIHPLRFIWWRKGKRLSRSLSNPRTRRTFLITSTYMSVNDGVVLYVIWLITKVFMKIQGRCKGSGKGGVKRHYKVLQGITKLAIRRLAHRGGVRRINGLIYEETHRVLKIFLENVIRNAVTYTEHAKRKMVTTMHVVYVLKRQGRTLYGFRGYICLDFGCVERSIVVKNLN
ncbi:hypothetical protein EZV62_023795 [Acer yangbiense]|uniref:Histone H4 n=1 Tax=Acer yangbiense TaxID=1000413 RepID=A0A5C7H2Z2_9ROSI|nr:hypothetical protein EZV62_023795 [Acer yangbiense]